MTRLDFYYFLTVALVAAVLFFPTDRERPRAHPHITAPSQVTKEQKAAHFLSVKDADHAGLGKSLDVCSGTAVGPHALLTGEHCLADGDATLLALDYATETHNILAVAADGRDHVLLLLDGTAFKNIEPMVFAPAVLNETLTFYGVGGGVYPPQPKYGRVAECEDPSDMDISAGIICAHMPLIPGDSGAAVYNTKGQIVSLNTYSVTDAPYTCINFALNFTEEQLIQAAAFSGRVEDLPGTAVPVKKKAPKKEKEVKFLDLFGGN